MSQYFAKSLASELIRLLKYLRIRYGDVTGHLLMLVHSKKGSIMAMKMRTVIVIPMME